jgi:Do/DeqQ family serine protease
MPQERAELLVRLSRLILCVAASGALTMSVAAEPKQVPQSNAEVTLSFAPVVKKAAPAVVNVYASRTEKVQQNPLFDDPVFQQFFGTAPSTPRSQTLRSLGSGVIVDASGLVVTNYHVINQMTDVKVALSDQAEYPAQIVLRDQRNDLAVLKIKGDGPFPTMELGDSDKVEVGDIALAIGDPFGVGQTVTQGIISALARTNVAQGVSAFYLQTDASINPGNSGGALVDTHARLVGINSAIFSQSGGSVGIGFAIPVDMVKIVVAAAKAGDKIVHRPWLGASLQGVTYDIAETFGMNRPIGALVTDVVDDGPSAAGGLQRGDLITAIDGKLVESPESFGFRFGTKPVGGTATLTVRRGSATKEVVVRLERAPATPKPDKVTIAGSSPFAGITAANLSPAIEEELSSPENHDGVVVLSVAPESNAAATAFQKGDMILAINDVPIKTTRDLVSATSGRNYYWKLSLLRGGEVINTVLNQ